MLARRRFSAAATSASHVLRSRQYNWLTAHAPSGGLVSARIAPLLVPAVFARALRAAVNSSSGSWYKRSRSVGGMTHSGPAAGQLVSSFPETGAREGAFPEDVKRAESLAAVAGAFRPFSVEEPSMSAIASIRFALRSLRHRPAYAAAVVTILALGIGGCAAIFSLVDAVLLRPLPYARVDSLVVVFADGSARGQGARLSTTPGDLHDWRESAGGAFEGLAAIGNVSPRITSLETPVVPLTHSVTANYFDVLGARAFLGRTFTAGDDEPGRNDVAMLSYALWRSRFGGDPGIVGRTIDLDGTPHTVVGVLGPDFYSAHVFNVQPDLWVPAAFEAEREDRVTRDVLVYGRLRPGVEPAAAERTMRTIAARIARDNPRTNDRWSVSIVPIREHAVGGFARIATLVMAAVGLVLLIACANVANLGLVRGTERGAEVAMKIA